jgi:hypothetical protein
MFEILDKSLIQLINKEKTMSKVGLWIDYRKAIIVSVKERWEEIKKVVLVSEQYLQHYFDSNTDSNYRPLQIPANYIPQHIFQERINIYYEEVIASICDANSILIFGSNTAKDELKYRLEMNKLGDRIIGIEMVAQMTERQISAKVLQQVKIQVGLTQNDEM